MRWLLRKPARERAAQHEGSAWGTRQAIGNEIAVLGAEIALLGAEILSIDPWTAPMSEVRRCLDMQHQRRILIAELSCCVDRSLAAPQRSVHQAT
ncbi:hypothetical protein [Tsukamurella soli]|uniref:Uncharacterized protein n=1 Tax=Tsukamurella soli TaxID=644556 RepID=A0ABP8K0M0_9ACTN